MHILRMLTTLVDVLCLPRNGVGKHLVTNCAKLDPESHARTGQRVVGYREYLH